MKTNEAEYKARMTMLLHQLKELKAFKKSVGQYVRHDDRTKSQDLRMVQSSEQPIPSFLKITAQESLIDEGH